MKNIIRGATLFLCIFTLACSYPSPDLNDRDPQCPSEATFVPLKYYELDNLFTELKHTHGQVSTWPGQVRSPEEQSKYFWDNFPPGGWVLGPSPIFILSEEGTQNYFLAFTRTGELISGVRVKFAKSGKQWLGIDQVLDCEHRESCCLFYHVTDTQVIELLVDVKDLMENSTNLENGK